MGNLRRKEEELIDKILDRADELGLLKEDRSDHKLDLMVTDRYNVKLDFKRFLEADDFNFIHDFSGIYRFLNRTTCKITECFLPRCSRYS